MPKFSAQPSNNAQLLSVIEHNDQEFFCSCLQKLAKVDPKKWPIERIVYSYRQLGYNAMIRAECYDLISAIVFNPDRSTSTLRVFLVFTPEEFRGRGFAKQLLIATLLWARKMKFHSAQVGLGNNAGATGILKSIERDRLPALSSINVTTGKITFSELKEEAPSNVRKNPYRKKARPLVKGRAVTS